MEFKSQKRMGAELLKCGESRIWMDPTKLAEIGQAITRSDVRRLINSGIIQKKQAQGVSRVRARKRTMQRRKGRRKGEGKRKGSFGTRVARKDAWISKVRPLRRILRELKDKKTIDSRTNRQLYKMIKGGMFRSKKHLQLYLTEHNITAEQYQEKPVKKVKTKEEKPKQDKKEKK